MPDRCTKRREGGVGVAANTDVLIAACTQCVELKRSEPLRAPRRRGYAPTGTSRRSSRQFPRRCSRAYSGSSRCSPSSLARAASRWSACMAYPLRPGCSTSSDALPPLLGTVTWKARPCSPPELDYIKAGVLSDPVTLFSGVNMGPFCIQLAVEPRLHRLEHRTMVAALIPFVEVGV